MSGDHTRFTFDPRKRYSGVLMQQGRVQLDSDWIEEIDIIQRRNRTTTVDILGPIGVPYAVSPDAFRIEWIVGPPADLSIGPGRLYVEGIQVEAFAEGATYRNQPFHPPWLAGFPPPEMPTSGGAVVFLDVWDREVTYVEDVDLLDDALGGADTTTRRQTVWQVKIEPRDAAACGLEVGDPPSAGRLTSRSIAPPTPDDPCILPPASGYRGLENRLYRIEVHDGGPLGTARFKWSRDNGSIVSRVREIAVSGTQTILTVDRIGRDQFLAFIQDQWVTVTDDHRDWMGEPGEMARIANIDETNRQIVLDRALPTGGQRPFGGTGPEIVARHTRVQRWDQTATSNTIDPDGLIQTAAGPIAIEDGIEIRFSTVPADGSFRAGDYWTFWARTASARIEELTEAPPRGIHHHYVQLAAVSSLGPGGEPRIEDCRPRPPRPGGDCCCTIIISPGEDVQEGIDALPPQGGCVCLKTGVHAIHQPLRITRGSIVLKAESPGTIVRSLGSGPALIVGDADGPPVVGVDVLGIDFEANDRDSEFEGVVTIQRAERVRIVHCGATSRERRVAGILATGTDRLSVTGCRIRGLDAGIIAYERCEEFSADQNDVDLATLDDNEVEAGYYGIAYVLSAFPARITRNAVSGATYGILLNDAPTDEPASYAVASIVADNIVICPAGARLDDEDDRAVGIDVAADFCAVTGNRVVYRETPWIGIRMTGSEGRVAGNVLVSDDRRPEGFGPVAIVIGVLADDADSPVRRVLIAQNVIRGSAFGILCSDASLLVVEGNVVEGTAGLAVFANQVSASTFCNNRIANAQQGFHFLAGEQNRIAGNDCRDSGVGITLIEEVGPQISGNRFEALRAWGLYAQRIGERLDVEGNRLTRCAGEMPDGAIALACLQVEGEANISGNEIRDTDVDGVASTAWGIWGDLVQEARIEGNLITYTNLARDPMREDRALIIRGLREFSLGENEGGVGFGISVFGNRFAGAGRTALIELLEERIDERNFVRFERVSFDHNYCFHVAPTDNVERAATVRLVGSRAIVMGNHIKATARSWPSVDFNGMSGPFVGNVTAGGAVNHTDFPLAELDFNQIA